MVFGVLTCLTAMDDNLILLTINNMDWIRVIGTKPRKNNNYVGTILMRQKIYTYNWHMQSLVSYSLCILTAAPQRPQSILPSVTSSHPVGEELTPEEQAVLMKFRQDKLMKKGAGQHRYAHILGFLKWLAWQIGSLDIVWVNQSFRLKKLCYNGHQ